jgi:hypothetical protein
MIDLQNYVNGENTDGKPAVTIRFDETKHPSEWSTVQYMTDFLAASGFSSATISALQAVVDANSPS